jgi:phage minor structural protein|uniref:Prophage tail endopeptidase domain-containing protein n=1 Tax=Thermorudis peleae TaxID=1382356 RepID=A0A831TIG1_9BACT
MRLAYAKPALVQGEYRLVLRNAFDIELEQEINGAETLRFAFPSPRDQALAVLDVERELELAGMRFVIRRIVTRRDKDGTSVVEVYSEAAWYDLAFLDPIEPMSFTDAPAGAVIDYILDGTGWRTGDVDITVTRNLELAGDALNRLRALRHVQAVYRGELVFDTVSRRVHLLRQQGRAEPVAAFAYRKNIVSVEREVDSSELVTRLYPFGKGGMTIEAANDGVPYVENFQWTSRLRVAILRDERFTNPWHLKEFAEAVLAEISKPRVRYRIRAADLSALAGIEHEAIRLGDTVWVYDDDLGLDTRTRVVRWRYLVDRPEQTELELATATPGIDELLARLDDTTAILEQADVVDRGDMRELMVFNYLINSRADLGFAHWINNGWEIDSENGVSGRASFRCTGARGVAKTLSQQVFPAHRESYTLSFQFASQGLDPGPNARVGVEVVIEYDDDTASTHFLSLLG